MDKTSERSAVVPERFASPVLLASSGGGHLVELCRIAASLGLDPEDMHWVVARTSQSEQQLADMPYVTWVREVKSRGIAAALRNLGAAFRIQRRVRPRLLITTGAAQVVPHLLAAAAYRTPIRYVESVARVTGPSVTGRLAAVLPGTELHAPVAGWGSRWVCRPDVLDDFEVETVTDPDVDLDLLLVSLGSEKYPFDRAVAAVREIAPHDADLVWQVGHTDATDLMGRQLNRWLLPEQLADEMAAASVVVVHGGAGSVLTALGAGKVPVVLPRAPERGEHVDDHQVQMTDRLAARGLAVVVEPGQQLDIDHLRQAARLRASDRGRRAPQPA